MKHLLPLLAVIALLAPNVGRADEASHRKAADALFSAMGMEALLDQSIDQMLKAQLSQNPALAQFQPQMKAFLGKYMSWSAMHDDMAKLYMGEFSEQELTDLAKFYKTPLGMKTMQKMPVLMVKGAEIGQKRVQEHLPELQAALGAKKAP